VSGNGRIEVAAGGSARRAGTAGREGGLGSGAPAPPLSGPPRYFSPRPVWLGAIPCLVYSLAR
jgi:hypothetical protein